MKKLNRQVGLAFALAAALWVPVGLGAAAPQNIPGLTQTGTNQFTVNTNQTNTVQLLEQFMALRDQLQTNQDEELRQLVAQMNSVPAEQKVEAVAAIINKLVEQRLAAHQRRQVLENRLLQDLIQTMAEVGGTGTNGTVQAVPGTTQPSPGVTQPTPGVTQPSPGSIQPGAGTNGSAPQGNGQAPLLPAPPQ